MRSILLAISILLPSSGILASIAAASNIDDASAGSVGSVDFVFTTDPFYSDSATSTDESMATDNADSLSYYQLQAEHALVATPHSEDFKYIAHDVIANVQNTCKVDYANFCVPKQMMQSSTLNGMVNDMLSIMNSPFVLQFDTSGRRRLIRSVDPRDSSKMERIRDYVNRSRLAQDPKLDGNTQPIAGGVIRMKPLPTIGAGISQISPFSQSLSHIGKMAFKDSNVNSGLRRREDPIQTRRLHADLNDEEDEEDKGDSHHHRDHDHGDHNDRKHDHEKNPVNNDDDSVPSSSYMQPPPKDPRAPCDGKRKSQTPPPPPPPPDAYGPPDWMYNGELGYGNDGDMCMYTNFDNLSEPCQESILDVYDARDQYWHEDVEEHDGHHVFGIIIGFIFITMLLRCCAWKFGPHAQRRKDVQAVLEVLQKNAELKAAVEAASGSPVPAPMQKCSSGRCCSFMTRLTFAIIASIMIVNTAGMVTLSILQQMIYVDENGNEHAPDAFFIFVLLFVVLFIETTLFIIVIRFAKKAFAKYRRSRSEEITAAVANDGANGGPTRRAAFSPTTFLNISSFFPSRSMATDYVPLSGMDESSHGNNNNNQKSTVVSEMVQYTPLQSSSTTTIQRQPLLQNAYIVTNLPPTANCITPMAIL